MATFRETSPAAKNEEKRMFSQAILGLFTDKKWQISLPTYVLQLVKSLPFHILEAHQGLAYISGGIPIIRAPNQ